MALTVNLNKGKNDDPAKAEDFMPDYLNKGQKDAQPQSLEELKQAMEEIADQQEKRNG